MTQPQNSSLPNLPDLPEEVRKAMGVVFGYFENGEDTHETSRLLMSYIQESATTDGEQLSNAMGMLGGMLMLLAGSVLLISKQSGRPVDAILKELVRFVHSR